jgi:hypothetical protein
MGTPDTRVDAFQNRLRTDAAFRKAILSDRATLLEETGLSEAQLGDAEPAIVGEGENTTLIFVERGARPAGEDEEGGAGAKGNADPQFPRRYYDLVNSTDRELNLETWALGLQEAAFPVPPGYIGYMRVSTIAEELLNACNLKRGSFLARDLVTNQVLLESWNVTCGKFHNVLTATGSGGGIAVVESHPEHPDHFPLVTSGAKEMAAVGAA